MRYLKKSNDKHLFILDENGKSIENDVFSAAGKKGLK